MGYYFGNNDGLESIEDLRKTVKEISDERKRANDIYLSLKNSTELQRLELDKITNEFTKRLNETFIKIEREKAQRSAKVKYSTEVEIAELRLSTEEKITKLEQLQYNDSKAQLRNVMAKNAALDKQIKMAEALSKYDFNEDSTSAKNMKKDLEKADKEERFKEGMEAGQAQRSSISNILSLSLAPLVKTIFEDNAGKDLKGKEWFDAVKSSLKENKKETKAQKADSLTAHIAKDGRRVTNQILKDENEANQKRIEAIRNNTKERTEEEIEADNERIAALEENIKNNNEEIKAGTKAANANQAAANVELASSIVSGLSTLAKQLESTMDSVSLLKGEIDTRLNGSNNAKLFGSYWSKMSVDMSALMLSPLIKEEDVVNNLKTVVSKGIARDVEQMAVLETMKDKIATTFNTFDSAVLRLIRIQDENTTAARLGMEASINAFLNEMYESTEYLESIASSVRSSLTEAEALMSGEEAVAFEYQVQKWMGSLYSVGMSDSAVTSIASALGKLASGDIEGITSGGVGNLMVMAANNANLSIADILADGLNESETNVLLNQMVGYLHELTTEANGNLVVQQQLAKVFGLTASDLKAAENLVYEYNGQTNQMKTIFNQGGTDAYATAISELFNMADSMYSRTSVGEMLQNVWSNVQYATASAEGNDPILYLTNKVADVLNTYAGGIEIPAISVMGNSVDTKLTVADIMQTAAMATGFTESLIGMIGSMIGTGGSGFTGSGLLQLVGINGSSVSRGASTSSSGTGTVYNASLNDMTDSATATAEDQEEETAVSAQEESTEVTNTTLNENIVKIYELLDSVVNGSNTLRVDVAAQTAMLNGLSVWW